MPPELLMVPFFSMKKAAGRRMTSVWMAFGSTPGRFQNVAVSVSQISWTTSVSRFAIASNVKLRLGTVTAGFCPMIQRSFSLLASASSNIGMIP